MNLQKRAVVAVSSAALLVGGAAALAPAASAAAAAGSSACNTPVHGVTDTINTNGVRLRTGPGTGDTVLRQLNKGAHIYNYCLRITNPKTQDAWGYIKYSATGQRGWVYAWYMTDYV